jgi:3-hydroxyacyl-CoA dehydrogenase
VTLIDAKQDALDAGLARARAAIDASERKGGSTPTPRRLRVAASRDPDARGRGAVDLVIEAIFENLAVKREVFGRLGQLCRPGAVLATNTSTLDVDAIADASGRPADVVGMHFFSPAHVMRLVEVVRGRESSREALATVHAVAKLIGRSPFRSAMPSASSATACSTPTAGRRS